MDGSCTGHGRLVRRGAELLGWWVVAVGVWMATLSAWSGHDLALAAACALPCAVLAVAGRRAVRGQWALPRETWRALLLLAVTVPADTVRVWVAALRRSRGLGFRSAEFDVGGRAAEAAGRRGVWAVLLSSTPGSFVVDIDPKDGRALLHGVSRQSRVERRLTR